jgi:hypothetical protein
MALHTGSTQETAEVRHKWCLCCNQPLRQHEFNSVESDNYQQKGLSNLQKKNVNLLTETKEVLTYRTNQQYQTHNDLKNLKASFTEHKQSLPFSNHMLQDS